MKYILMFILIYVFTGLLVYLNTSECCICLRDKKFKGIKCRLISSVLWLPIFLYALYDKRFRFTIKHEKDQE